MVLWKLVRCGGQFWAKGGYTLEHQLLQACTETHLLICSLLVHFSVPCRHKPVSTEKSEFSSHWRSIFHLVSQYKTPTLPMTTTSPAL